MLCLLCMFQRSVPIVPTHIGGTYARQISCGFYLTCCGVVEELLWWYRQRGRLCESMFPVDILKCKVISRRAMVGSDLIWKDSRPHPLSFVQSIVTPACSRCNPSWAILLGLFRFYYVTMKDYPHIKKRVLKNLVTLCCLWCFSVVIVRELHGFRINNAPIHSSIGITSWYY
jgi:hypothetical protein